MRHVGERQSGEQERKDQDFTGYLSLVNMIEIGSQPPFSAPNFSAVSRREQIQVGTDLASSSDPAGQSGPVSSPWQTGPLSTLLGLSIWKRAPNQKAPNAAAEVREVVEGNPFPPAQFSATTSSSNGGDGLPIGPPLLPPQTVGDPRLLGRQTLVLDLDATLIDTCNMSQRHFAEPDFIYEGESSLNINPRILDRDLLQYSQAIEFITVQL